MYYIVYILIFFLGSEFSLCSGNMCIWNRSIFVLQWEVSMPPAVYFSLISGVCMFSPCLFGFSGFFSSHCEVTWNLSPVCGPAVNWQLVQVVTLPWPVGPHSTECRAERGLNLDQWNWIKTIGQLRLYDQLSGLVVTKCLPWNRSLVGS